MPKKCKIKIKTKTIELFGLWVRDLQSIKYVIPQKQYWMNILSFISVKTLYQLNENKNKYVLGLDLWLICFLVTIID